MGIHNFKLFLNSLNYNSSNTLKNYDSIFIDIQSFLYRAISNSFKSEEEGLCQDICEIVLIELSKLLENIFSFNCFTDYLKIIISFDGESIPMKFPTQKQRRNVNVQGRNLYKVILFGYNTISDQVCKYIITMLTNYCSKVLPKTKLPSKLEFFILGSDTKGEGEHKLFFLGSHLKCQNPIIVSVDNDVFIIALSQMSKFQSIQIYKSDGIILNVNDFKSNYEICIFVSLLFGNDFIPPIIHLSESNCLTIQEALKKCEKQHMPHIFRTVLKTLIDDSKMRYKKPPQLDETIVIEFWKTCFWVLDYYKKYNFPQKYMENLLFDIFEKNQIIMVLLDEEYSEETFQKAHLSYNNLKTSSLMKNPKHVIFTPEQLKLYNHYFLEPKNLEMYHVINIDIV